MRVIAGFAFDALHRKSSSDDQPRRGTQWRQEGLGIRALDVKVRKRLAVDENRDVIIVYRAKLDLRARTAGNT